MTAIACACGQPLEPHTQRLDVLVRLEGDRVAELRVAHRTRECSFYPDGAEKFAHAFELRASRRSLRRLLELEEQGADPLQVLALARLALTERNPR